MAGLLLTVACTKEAVESTPEGARGKRLILVTDQQRADGAKVLVNGPTTMWMEDDEIHVNGTRYAVEYVDGQFQLSDDVTQPETNKYYAAYASYGAMQRSDVRNGISLDEGKDYATITYNIPRVTYHLGWEGNYPIINDFPLMGMTHRDSTRLYMRPVGACIDLQLTNRTANTIVVDSVVLTCNLSINGKRTLKFWPGVNGQKPQLASGDYTGTTASDAASKRVTVIDPQLTNRPRLKIECNKTRSFPIPLASTQLDPGSSERPQITITVYGKSQVYVRVNEFGQSMLLNEVPFSHSQTGPLSRQIPVGAYFTAPTELTDENIFGYENHELHLLGDGFSGENFEEGEGFDL